MTARFITFYSFKGGVGRSMALANVAYRLAAVGGHRVVVVDWDLEAPGLSTYFGVTAEQQRASSGVLDYLLAWSDALANQDPAPPDVRSMLVPVRKAPWAPPYGAVSVLTSGRLDDGYDRRLSSFDWRRFYGKEKGALAVETLRSQLAEIADVVLVDSRTGFTDASGVCTVQLPDAVVLLTAPNEQSWEGTLRVARGLSLASADARAGRPRPRVWLAVGRVSLVEETETAERWFAEHQAAFEQGTMDGLWSGREPVRLPFRARWSFGESLLVDASTQSDPLHVAYDELAATLATWIARLDGPEAERRREVGELRARVAAAEQRGDVIGLAGSLMDLALALGPEEREEALRLFERAQGIALGTGNDVLRRSVHYRTGLLEVAAGRLEDAAAAFRRADAGSTETADQSLRVAVLSALAHTESLLGHRAAAETTAAKALALGRESGDVLAEQGLLFTLGCIAENDGDAAEARTRWESAVRLGAESAVLPLAHEKLRDVAMSPDEAVTHAKEAIRAYRARADHDREAACWRALALRLRDLGRLAMARGAWEEALEVSRTAGDRDGELESRVWLMRSESRRAKLHATAALGAADAALAEARTPDARARYLEAIVLARTVLRQPKKARAALLALATEREKLGDGAGATDLRARAAAIDSALRPPRTRRAPAKPKAKPRSR